MAKYSKAHEREESSKMWKGFWHSTFGILFCWVPGLGILLSISGFARQVVRMTQKHRLALTLLLLYGLTSLAVTLGTLFLGLYLYAQDQQIFLREATKLWHSVTGQSSLPGQSYQVFESDGSALGIGNFMETLGFGAKAPEDTDPGMMLEPDEHIDESGNHQFSSYGELVESYGYFEGDGEDYDEDDYVQLDFGYEIVDDAETDESGLARIEYKLVTELAQPTDQNLMDLFADVVYEDGYDLHTVSVYRTEDEASGEYTLAQLTQTAPEALPTLERRDPSFVAAPRDAGELVPVEAGAAGEPGEETPDEYVQLDFGYEIVDDAETDEGELKRIEYKLIIEIDAPTDQELMDLFADVCYEDEYDLHTVSVYHDEAEAEGEYTMARLTQAAPEETPTLERK